MISIDAHQHFWSIVRGDYGWLTPEAHPAIARDYGPDDLTPHLAAARIDATILVQAAPTTAETEYLLRIAATTPYVAGVVGWIDFEGVGARDMLSCLAENPALCGVRPMVQDIADPDWLARRDLTSVFDALVAHGLRFDALVKPPHLPALRAMTDRHPDLKVVIDHAAKPDIAGGQFESWMAAMRDIAANSAARCKMSGLASEAGTAWSRDDLRQYIDAILDMFGPDRVMWGSDWPVVEEAGGYQRWHNASVALVDPAAHDAVFGGTAARFYGIEP